MANHTQTVIDVKAQLVALGFDLSGPCGAFAITCRVAWALRDEGWGLIAKSPGQNGCTVPEGRYAVDAILQRPSGETIDLLINAETENTPAWQTTGAAPLGAWSFPFDADAGQPVPVPTPIPTPTPTPVPVPQGCTCKTELEGVRQQLDLILIELHQIRDRKIPNYVGRVAYLGSVKLTPE